VSFNRLQTLSASKTAIHAAFSPRSAHNREQHVPCHRTTVAALRRPSAWLTAMLSFVVCLFTAGCGGGMVSHAESLSLVASSTSVNLGSVPVGKATNTKVSLVNKKSAVVHVTQISLSGKSFSVVGQTGLPVSVPVGGTFIVNINFVPAAAGQATGQLSIKTDASTSPTLIALSGVGAADVSATPVLTGLSCASASMGGTATDLCTVTLSAAAPSGGFRVALSSNNGAVTVSPAALVHEGVTSAQFTANATPVTTAQTVTLTASAGTVTETFALQLNVPVPTLSISPASVSFGTVTVNTPATQTVTLNSTGTAAVTISGAAVTGPGFTLASGTFPLTLNPGQSATLSVQFDPSAQGAAAGQLTITSNSSVNSKAVISLSGTGAPQLSGLSCASSSIGGTVTDLCTVTLSGPALSGGFRVVLSSNNAAVTVSPAALVHEGATSIQFKAYATPVTTAQTATLTASAGAVTKTFAIQLSVPVSTLSVSPASVAFGSVAVNTPLTQTVTMNSTGTAAVTISGAAVTGTGFTLASGTFPMTLNPGQSATLTVQFDPSALGAATGQLTVTSNSSVNSKAVIALSGTGAPQLSGLSCANASMGGTATDLCTVTISGPAPAAGFRVVLSSNNPAVTVSPAALIHANTTSVQFTANATPVATAQTVTLTASAGSVTETLAIQLNVPVPTLSIGVTSLAFGSVSVNTPVTQTVTVNSTGTAAVTISGATVTGAGFTLASGTFPMTLNPGQSATLSVQFDPSVQGSLAGQLTISSNSSTNSTAVIALSGTGLPQLTGISCVSASVVGTTTDLCTVTISGPAPDGGFRVALSSSNAAVTISPAALVHAGTTNQQFVAYATPVTTAQVATLTASVGTVTQSFALQINAALPALGTSSASVPFGNVPVNVTAVRTLTLTSTGAATLTITAAAVTGTGFNLTPAAFPVSLTSGQSTTLNVQFDPSTLGAATGLLTISSNSSTNGIASIVLSGTGAPSGSFPYNGSPLAATLVPPNPATPISSNFFGMTIHHTSTPFPSFPVSTLRLWDVAAWSTIETASQQYDWSHTDSSIATGNKNGVSDYIFTFGSVPLWASTNPSDPCIGGTGTGSCASPNMAAFDEFATQIVQRYCGKIKYYETWNEVNNSFYWDGTNQQLLTVAQHLYSIAKDPANCGCTNGVCAPNGGVNPNKVMTPSISKISSSNLAWFDSYLSGAGSQYPYADVVAFHGYGATNPENIIPQIQSLNLTLANHGLGALELWNTEASWGSITSAVGEQQASWLMRYHMAQAVAGVARFTWYAYDNCGWGTLWEAPWCSNPQMPTSQPTPPGLAYAVVQSWMSGATLTGCRQYVNGLWACELQRTGGYDAWMLWSSTGNTISVPIDASSGLMYYIDWQNNVNALPSEVLVDQTPMLLENQTL